MLTNLVVYGYAIGVRPSRKINFDDNAQYGHGRRPRDLL
jgi:hypothetical protein